MNNGTENTKKITPEMKILIDEAIGVVTEKKLLTEEDEAISSEVATSYMAKITIMGGQPDQFDTMMTVAFAMGYIKAKQEKPKLSIVED